jgi:riboflavin synthase
MKEPNMFTGIITHQGIITQVSGESQLKRFRIMCDLDIDTIAIGASIACGGPCLTVIAKGIDEKRSWFDVDVAAETLALTTARDWQLGTRLNVERSLKIGDELGGHIVTGHIDVLAQIIAREQVTDASYGGGLSVKFTFRIPSEVAPFTAKKGSVTLDGTSLTVNDVLSVLNADDTLAYETLSVLLIPHTLDITTWGIRQASDFVNLEVDLMARYAARLVQRK